MTNVLLYLHVVFFILFVDGNEINWYRLHSMDNKMAYPNTAFETVISYKAQCAQRCFENLNCMSFFYDINTKMCYLHSNVYNVTSPTQVSNTTYYVSLSRECHETYTWESGVCFRIYDMERNFTGARDICQGDGGDLIIFDSQEKSDFVIPYLIPGDRYFFGIFNIKIDKSFDMVDGRSSDDFTFSLWKPGRPDGPFGVQLCGSFNHYSGGFGWSDNDCTSLRKFICEIN